ncbi:prepilin-type N-terminal cleavage/methylation domain-containing protein [Leminorella grimontii]|uniref:prepilin-type N-terminal cleavage/methylation domain-containing protein n=1 Tax=Leminorella grimontii TaxID=82981 RepID=UPI002083C075|nr:prepilin-type N-terminal cleavage/methylation domain-containing protein [Leminorella grimontii]GKX58793.1 hypothetical protein SOASR031_11080 [Leminorella grimontii]
MTASALRQEGFSLIETLVAMLLFSVTVLGLMHYQQALTSQFYHYANEQKAWRLAAQALELYPISVDEDAVLKAAGWRFSVADRWLDERCDEVTAEVSGPGRVSVSLERLFCRPSGEPP